MPENKHICQPKKIAVICRSHAKDVWCHKEIEGACGDCEVGMNYMGIMSEHITYHAAVVNAKQRSGREVQIRVDQRSIDKYTFQVTFYVDGTPRNIFSLRKGVLSSVRW